MNIIDSHFHIYKSDQAGILAQGGGSFCGFSGTLEEAKSFLDRGRVKKLLALAVIPIVPMREAAMKKRPEDLSAAKREEFTKELDLKLQKRLSDYNDYLCRSARDDGRMEPVIAADGSLNTDFMIQEILTKIQNFGIKIIKIHPAVNGITPEHPGYEPVFELAQDKGITIISHGGLSGDDPEGKYCSPKNFENILRMFPKLKIIVAHLAYPHTDDLLQLAKKFDNLYTDISFVMRNSPLTDDEFVEIISKFGIERVLFGSDFPWSDPEADADRLLKLKLNEKEIDLIARQNAIKIFNLDE
jgi:predicted TIM-barrel fold metal-dependent hydrolase